MLFDWDMEKAETNARKPAVTFQEAVAVFRDPNSLEEFEIPISKTSRDFGESVSPHADYERELASGMGPQDAMKPGEHHFRRATRLANSEDVQPKNNKVNVTIRLDGDIVEFFKQRAAAPHAAPYQTQINSALREYIERNRSEDTDVHKLLRNEQFIAALTKCVRSYEKAS